MTISAKFRSITVPTSCGAIFLGCSFMSCGMLLPQADQLLGIGAANLGGSMSTLTVLAIIPAIVLLAIHNKALFTPKLREELMQNKNCCDIGFWAPMGAIISFIPAGITAGISLLSTGFDQAILNASIESITVEQLSGILSGTGVVAIFLGLMTILASMYCDTDLNENAPCIKITCNPFP